MRILMMSIAIIMVYSIFACFIYLFSRLFPPHNIFSMLQIDEDLTTNNVQRAANHSHGAFILF